MGRVEARRTRLTAGVGVVVLALVAGIGYLTATSQSGLPWTGRTTVAAEFADVGALKVFDEVRQNGVFAGRVSGIEYVDGAALVTMELDGDRTLYRNARASIRDYSPLGTKLVELAPGSPDAGPLGDAVIDSSRTASSADLYELLDVFDPATRAAASSALREAGGGVIGLGPEVQDYLRNQPDLLADLGTVAAALTSDEADLPQLLRTARALTERFDGRRQQLAELVQRTEATLGALAVDGAEPLEATLDALPVTLEGAGRSFEALDRPLAEVESAVTDLAPGATALGVATDDLRAVLRDGTRPLRKVPDVADRATPAVGDLTRTFADARPLAPKLSRAIVALASPLQELAPYAPDIAQLAARGRSLVGEDVNGAHYARVSLAPSSRTALGGLLEDPPDGARNPDPKPGEPDTDSASPLIGGGR